MPEKKTTERVRKLKREGKSPSTQAGEFVREEIRHIRGGKHGARSTKQAIAIGLSKARRAGVRLPAQPGAKKPARKKRKISKAASKAMGRGALKRLKKYGSEAASHASLSRQAKRVARKRGPAARKRSAKKAARTRSRTRAKKAAASKS
jgi:hypothetical protein